MYLYYIDSIDVSIADARADTHAARVHAARNDRLGIGVYYAAGASWSLWNIRKQWALEEKLLKQPLGDIKH